MKSAGNLKSLKKGAKQGIIQGGDADATFKAIAKKSGVKLSEGQTRFKTSDGVNVGIHRSQGTVRSDGSATIDLNINGKVIKIRFKSGDA